MGKGYQFGQSGRWLSPPHRIHDQIIHCEYFQRVDLPAMREAVVTKCQNQYEAMCQALGIMVWGASARLLSQIDTVHTVSTVYAVRTVQTVLNMPG